MLGEVLQKDGKEKGLPGRSMNADLEIKQSPGSWPCFVSTSMSFMQYVASFDWIGNLPFHV